MKPPLLILARRVIPVVSPPLDDAGVLVRDGRVEVLGPAQDLRRAYPEAAATDIGDCVLMPAFVDAHVHLFELVRLRSGVDLEGAQDAEMVAEKLLAGRPLSGWRLGFGLDRNRFSGFSKAARDFLDRVEPQLPLVVFSRDLHTVWGNSPALAAAGLPLGSGELTEGDTLPLRRIIPAPEGEEWARAFSRVTRELHRAGIARVGDFSGFRLHRRLLAAQEDRALPLRVTTSIHLDEVAEAKKFGFRSGRLMGRVTCGYLKLFGDGSLGSRTAWMKKPYRGMDRTGVRTFDTESLRALVADSHAGGVRVALHAIGDAAVCQASAVLTPIDRVEHAQHAGAEDIESLARAGCACCVNPQHIGLDWRAAMDVLEDGGKGAYPLSSLARAGIMLAFGSDAPVAPADPARAMAWAASRKGPDGVPEGGFFPGERLDRQRCLEAATKNASSLALAPFEGWIGEGSCADLAALSSDPTRMVTGDETADLFSVKVTRLWIGGEEQKLE